MVSFSIQISDPIKHGEGLNAYMAYKVAVQISEKIVGLDTTSYNVVRRFSDFVWLRSQLHDLFPYVMIPSLPEKQAVGRFNTDFVDIRHRALQRFIDRVAAHPVLNISDPFQKFISFPYESFASLREGSRSELVKGVTEGGKRTLMKFLKSASNAVGGAIATARGNAAVSGSSAASKNAEDEAFVAVDAYLLGQTPLLTALYNEAAGLAVRSREQAQLLLDFGAALRGLAQTETGPLSENLVGVGLASWTSSTAAYEKAVCEAELFVEKLADFVRNTKSVRDLVEERVRASSELSSHSQDVERLRANIVAYAASPTADSIRDKAKAEAELVVAQQAVADARAYYIKVSNSVISELERHRACLTSDLKQMIVDYIAIQARTELKLAQAWEKIASGSVMSSTDSSSYSLSNAPVVIGEVGSDNQFAQTDY